MQPHGWLDADDAWLWRGVLVAVDFGYSRRRLSHLEGVVLEETE